MVCDYKIYVLWEVYQAASVLGISISNVYKDLRQGQGQDQDFQRVYKDNRGPGPRPRTNITG